MIMEHTLILLKDVKTAGIDVPIILGLKPISAKSQLNIIPHLFHVNLPNKLSSSIENSISVAEVLQIGVNWSIQQAKELIEEGVQVIHLYTTGKSENVSQIAQAIF